MYVIKDRIFCISVRNLVEFLCRSGDLESGTGGPSDIKWMQEGARLHRKIQKEMGANYHAEVPLRIDLPVHEQDGERSYTIRLEGRADGIIDEGTGGPAECVTVDEIKTMRTDLTKMKEPVYVHKAQAMCYAYIYAVQNRLAEIGVRMTYCNPETEELKRFKESFTEAQITAWFDALLASFIRWTDFIFESRRLRAQSIAGLAFPYEYRPGQRNLVVQVYRAIEQSRNLYIQAPTGVGKTLSTVYPAVQAVGQGMLDKVFYLTSKTITRTVAEDTFALLRTKGLAFRTLTLTAKDKVCCLKERKCTPQDCPYAKGHFDRINDAVFELVTGSWGIDRAVVADCAQRHEVCPFELSLDASYWCDGIICDYNYVFDPDASLKRYFGDGSRGDYIFLVDEAHNLVDRAREMYSAVLVKEDFLKVRRLIRDTDRRLAGSLERCNRELLEMKRACDTYRICSSPGRFPAAVERCYTNMQVFLEKNRTHAEMDTILELFFKMRHFLNMYDGMDDRYVVYTEHDSAGNFCFRLFCVDPSGNIAKRLEQGRCTVFFSATLLPVDYYKEMLSGNRADYAVYAESAFSAHNRRVLVGRDVSSRYTRRNEKEYEKISRYIYETASAHPGKYMVFFPSYSYMEAVRSTFAGRYPGVSAVDCSTDTEELKECLSSGGFYMVTQDMRMGEHEKERFLQLFDEYPCGGSLVGFCVTGGIFSEGIDLKADSLIGVVVVGTGLPMLCRERDILKNYFDACGKDGYAYAYVYPGMNKVLQAAGRVIRTSEDRGVIELLDDRFLTGEYRRLYPREWTAVYPVTLENVSDFVHDFWKNIVQ